MREPGSHPSLATYNLLNQVRRINKIIALTLLMPDLRLQWQHIIDILKGGETTAVAAASGMCMCFRRCKLQAKYHEITRSLPCLRFYQGYIAMLIQYNMNPPISNPTPSSTVYHQP